MYKGDKNIYIEGIGTFNHEKDDAFAKSKGDSDYWGGRYGAAAKINSAHEALKEFVTDGSISTIELDIFGFSRGAALARHFANDVKKYQNVNVNFLGLFDTVESFSSNHIENYKCSVKDVAKTVFQLNALHETRQNFPLTTIFSDDVKEKSSIPSIDHLYYLNHPYIELESGGKNYIELTVPGSHSDIGGGYKDMSQEDYLIDEKEKYEMLLEHILFKNILNSDNTKIKRNTLYKYTYFERPKNTFVSGRLQWVNLLLMVDKAKEFGCTFDEIGVAEYEKKINSFFDKEELYKNLDKKETVDNSLKNLKEYSYLIRKLENQKNPLPEEEIKKISNFIHISVNYSNLEELMFQASIDQKSKPLQLPRLNSMSLEDLSNEDFAFAAITLNEVFIDTKDILVQKGESDSDTSIWRPLKATDDWIRVIKISDRHLTSEKKEAV